MCLPKILRQYSAIMKTSQTCYLPAKQTFPCLHNISALFWRSRYAIGRPCMFDLTYVAVTTKEQSQPPPVDSGLYYLPNNSGYVTIKSPISCFTNCYACSSMQCLYPLVFPAVAPFGWYITSSPVYLSVDI